MVMTTSARQLGGHLDGDCGKGGEAPQRSAAELGRRKTTGVRMFERSLLATVSMWQTQRGPIESLKMTRLSSNKTCRHCPTKMQSPPLAARGELEDSSLSLIVEIPRDEAQIAAKTF